MSDDYESLWEGTIPSRGWVSWVEFSLDTIGIGVTQTRMLEHLDIAPTETMVVGGRILYYNPEGELCIARRK